MSVAEPLREYIDSLVHPAVQRDPVNAPRHRAFIGTRLLGSSIALAAFPVYLAVRGVPSGLEIAVFTWFVAPILIACYLSRTGWFDAAYILSSLSLTCLLSAVAYKTGGISSFAAVGLLMIPLQAALSGSRKVVAASSALALLAAAALFFIHQAGLTPASQIVNVPSLEAVGIVAGTLYAAGLAFGLESLTRGMRSLRSADDDRYGLLTRNITDVVVTLHRRSGAVCFVSPAAESVFGVRGDELMGQGLFDRVHVADRPAYLSALADAAQGEHQSVQFRFKRPLAGAQGGIAFSWIAMQCKQSERLGPAGHEREVVAVMRDISDRRAQDEALEIARAETERANAAKTRFLATVSHELRTPLNAIIGFSEMLASEDQMRLDLSKRREYARLIKDSGSHLLSVVNGILDMSKMEAGDFEITPEPFAPARVIANCCDILALRAREAGLDLVIRGVEELPDIRADKRAFKQIMLNLLSNAIKFSHPGGRILIASKQHGGRLEVSVEDNGVGISAADLPRIGNPFFQARSAYDRRHDGTGLGLSIVKGLVSLHGGEMKVRSELGKGTAISIFLPMDCEEAIQQRNATEPTPFELVHKQSKGQVRKSA